MTLKDRIESAITYCIGGGAITLPAILHTLTDFFQFLGALAGFVLVIWRYLHDSTKAKIK